MSDRRRRPKPWVQADYPSAKSLSKFGAMDLLRHGPSVELFKPWLRESTLWFAGMEAGTFGFAHVYGGSDGDFHCDIRLFSTQETLNWGLEALHGLNARCDDSCDGLFYWTPTTVAVGAEGTR